MRHPLNIVFPLIFLCGALVPGMAFSKQPAESVCHGTPEHGSLESGWKLPVSGPNFEPYSSFGPGLGRTYVHSAVHRVVVAAYASLATDRPATRYMYGETGKEKGGRFRPHKTHQNGLSVDFMVPVKDRTGKSVPLRTSPLNKFGYDIEFSSTGEWEDLKIDFDAMADHLAALEREARKQGIGIRRVIFDNVLRAELLSSGRESTLRTIEFTKFKPWVRHDEHYHVDFDVACAK